jgi:HK97 family phage prohead protease
MPNVDYDFSGYVTKADVKCTDGRTIKPNAFEHQDGEEVPLVWRHGHDSATNVLGHVRLENRKDGVYGYAFLNDTDQGKNAKALIQHKDVKALSIWANELVEKAKNVLHGKIREVSLVLSGANPGAVIDYVAVQHEDGELVNLSDEAIIYTGLEIDIPDVVHEDVVIEHAEGGETIEEVFNSLSDKQKSAVYEIIGQIMEDEGLEIEQLDDDEGLQHDEGETQIMKKNVFDGTDVTVVNGPRPQLSHDDFNTILANAKRIGSLREAFLAHDAGVAFLEHAGTYGIGSDRTNLELLFPDAQAVGSREPSWIARKMEWVSGVMGGVRHSPFSRLKSVHADITADEARARGYITGNEKVEEVFPVLRRITTPHTIYKKQKLDRDDIIDITDFDVVRWLKGEMRFMLDEEIARAILVGDGRDPVVEVDDHIPTTNIRPVYQDSTVYTYNVQVALARTDDEMIDDIITAFEQYRGSGLPTMYVAPSQLTKWLLLKDNDGRRLYRNMGELASEMRCRSIVEVPILDGVENDAGTHNLRAIIVNLTDYTAGADKGGQIAFFDDFDIDYNQYKYLIETRMSGALTVPKSAITLEQSKT